jgi:hypothetical protein
METTMQGVDNIFWYTRKEWLANRKHVSNMLRERNKNMKISLTNFIVRSIVYDAVKHDNYSSIVLECENMSLENISMSSKRVQEKTNKYFMCILISLVVKISININ